MEASESPAPPPGSDHVPDPDRDLALVRRFEPVLRFTSGELFFPMPVDNYLARASLWRAASNRPPELLLDHGTLTKEKLAEEAALRPGDRLFLRYAPSALKRKDLKAWRRRPDRPKFAGVSRLAAVGLLGRVIDSGMRLSLTLRGRVPGGLAAAAQMQYATTVPPVDAYHARVSRDGGYTIIQYWYLYAMNDWRSSFSGVNDHESDWEQVTVYLAGDEPEIVWLAFSSHDETGDELRRRADDPDIDWIDAHPVVNAGAGSHSGAYLAGDYLVRVQPPALARMFQVVNAVRSSLFPWTKNQPSLGVGIPYIDYRRGDGVRIGPGTDRPWTPIVIDTDTPWVRDYRGLWGLDTDDPFGGERAPAGPRYERNGAIRASWADPVGWAGLDKVPPTEDARREAAAARLEELDTRIADLDTQIAASQEELRRASATRAAAGEPATAALRSDRREALNERDLLRSAPAKNPGPHDHLKHRAIPDTATPTNALLRFWSGASLSILLMLLGLALLLDLNDVPWILVWGVALVMGIEALLRGRLGVFLLGLAILVALGVLTWLFFTHLRAAFGIIALTAAVAIGVANLRNTWAQR
jgi:hypothetical protein